MATERIQIEIRYLPINIWRLYGVVIKFGDYSGGIAQIDDEIEEKLKFRICPNSTISPFVSKYDMSNMRCFPIGGMKKQHDAILESFGTPEAIILTTHSPTVNHLLSSFIFSFTLKNLEISSSLAFLDLRNYSKSNSDLAAKRSLVKIF